MNAWMRLAKRMGRSFAIPLALLCIHAASASAAFDPGKANFSLFCKDLVLEHRIMSLSVQPAEKLALEVFESRFGASFQLDASAGWLLHEDERSWQWLAPSEPGLCRATVYDTQSDDAITLNLFVLLPFEQAAGGRHDGYEFGRYPDEPLDGKAIYLPPPGFIEVTPANVDIQVTPHFTLGQFLCKQAGGFPKYVALRTELLLKLELILERVNRSGIDCSSFTVMSGFRTPSYNRRIGNREYSRHVWGDAVDIFIDEHPVDGRMDDLNRDGRINVDDAAVLYLIAEALSEDPAYEQLEGGLGLYRRNSAHGPFIHVDARGYRARWGAIDRARPSLLSTISPGVPGVLR